MGVKLKDPENFSIFCKNCGSYSIELWLDIDDSIVLECDKCDMKEEI